MSVASGQGPSVDPRIRATPEPRGGTLLDRVLSSGREHLLSLQAPDGHWCAELEGDSILEAEYLLTLYFLGRQHEPRFARAARYLRSCQLPQGGWHTYPGGPADVNPTVKAYFALKLAGDDPQAAHMVRARGVARELGGVEACNSFTKIYLAIFGQYEWESCPAVPPELVLFPRWFPFNLYEMSSWTRAIVVPLSLIWARKPLCPVAAKAGIGELRVPTPAAGRPALAETWKLFFFGVDRAFKAVEASRIRPFRRLAERRAEEWILEHLRDSDGLGAIFPPIVNTIFAFKALGYADDDPILVAQARELERLEIEEGDTLRVQPCFSPVWDTVLTLSALVEAGLDADAPQALEAARWVLEREVRQPGDWRYKAPDAGVGGWYFEYANEFYPDCDDTAQVLTSLSKLDLRGDLGERWRESSQRAAGWLMGMQCRSGGWASFDKDCDREFLTHIPFADHNAMIDPPTVDITARVLEALSRLGIEPGHPAVRRGVRFILDSQEEDGSWYGRWGCNYLYGTWLALTGLAAAGEDPSRSWGRRAVAWLQSRQNADGGWGELPASYADPGTKGQGPSTASQTAWAVLGLLAAGRAASPAVRRGVDYLLAEQRDDGSWHDEFWTGTGFPQVFYLRYHLYATYFPLQALGLYKRSLEERG